MPLENINKYSSSQVLSSLTSLDSASASLLVSRGLVPSLVSSPAFPLLVRSLAEEADLAQNAVEQLQQAGHLVQAASIEVRLEKCSTTSLTVTVFRERCC